MKKSPFRIHVLTIATLTGLSIFSTAHAAVLFQDDFDRTGALNGSTPTSDPISATWSAAAAYQTDGTSAAAPDTAQVSAFIPISLSANSIYTLTATMTVQQGVGSGGWLALGFVPLTNVNTAFFSNEPLSWMLANNGGGAQTFYGSAFGGEADYSLGFSGIQTFSIALDTTDGSLTYSQNGTAFRTVAGALSPGQIASGIAVGIGSQNNTGTFDTVSLSVAAVPEPSTVALVAAGLGLVVFVARRRHSFVG